jgi:hypothetical protein
LRLLASAGSSSGVARFLDKPMQRDEMLTVKAPQHARHPFRRQIRPNFPEAISHRAA